MRNLIIGIAIGMVLGVTSSALATLPSSRMEREYNKFQENADGNVTVRLLFS